jgi:predicted hydrocarbon binding protein
MLPARLIAILKKGAEEEGDTSLLYRSARIEGYNWFRNMVENGFVRNIDEITNLGIEILTLAGWGKFSLIQFDRTNKKIIIKIENSSEAKTYTSLYPDSKKTCCDVSRGFFAGGYAIPLKMPNLEFYEDSCYATNKLNCVIIGQPKNDIDLKNENNARQIGDTKELDLSFLDKSVKK